MTLTIANVAQTDGADNQPGVVTTLLYNVKDNLTTIPDYPAVTDETTGTTIDDDFVIATGKPFKTIEVVSETGMVKGEWVGDRAGGQGKYTFNGFIRKSAAAEYMFRQMHNSRGFFPITELDGTVRLLGTAKNFATIVMKEYKGGTEGKPDGPGYEIEIVCFGPTATPPRFTGSAPIA